MSTELIAVLVAILIAIIMFVVYQFDKKQRSKPNMVKFYKITILNNKNKEEIHWIRPAEFYVNQYRSMRYSHVYHDENYPDAFYFLAEEYNEFDKTIIIARLYLHRIIEWNHTIYVEVDRNSIENKKQ